MPDMKNTAIRAAEETAKKVLNKTTETRIEVELQMQHSKNEIVEAVQFLNEVEKRWEVSIAIDNEAVAGQQWYSMRRDILYKTCRGRKPICSISS